MMTADQKAAWAKSIKKDLMGSIGVTVNSLTVRAKNQPDMLSKIQEIVGALESKDAAWWIDHAPNQAGVTGDPAMRAWKEVAAEIAK